MTPRQARAYFAAAGAAVVTLVAVQAALAEAPRSQFTAKDQTAARAVVVKASDLGVGWTGSVKKGTVNGPTACAGWNPRQSDLVITGVAESEFSSQAVVVISGAQVYKTTRMAALDWQRTVVDVPMRCLAKEFTAGGGDELKVISIKRISFPKLATYAARFRVVADYKGDSTVRVFLDAVLVGRGRTVAMIGLVAPYAQRADADAAEVRLAKIVLSRIKT
jgi:hypothetical protein